MDYEVEVTYSEATVRHAARCFLTRFIRRDVLIRLGGALMALGALVWLEGTWPYAAILGGMGLALVALVVSVGLAYTHSAVTKFQSMRDPVVRWSFGDNSFAARSDLGSTELKWEALSQVWRFHDVWLLFFGASGWGYSTLPTNALSPEVKEFILSRIKTHGGKIT